MKKKRLFINLLIVVIFGIICLFTKYANKIFINNLFENKIHYSINEKSEETSENIKLYVYGQQIKTGNQAKINHDSKSAHIPLIAMCKAMGAKVTWFGDEIVFLIFEDETYILNAKKESLKEIGSNINFIAYPPGGREYVRFYELVDKEIFVDDLSLTRFIYARNAIIKIDFDFNIIYIDNRTD